MEQQLPAASSGSPQTVGSAEGTGTVDSDRGCVKCGYNVRGLPFKANCPECGTPVIQSLRGILLQFADPTYIKEILTGTSWVLNGILVSIVLAILGGLLGLGAAFVAPNLASGTILLSSFVSLAVGIWIFLGYLKLTTPDPQFTGTERPDSARQVVRVAAIASIVISALQLIVGGISISAGSVPGGLLGILGSVLGFASLIAFAVQFFATMNYMMWMAGRFPDMWIYRRAKTYRWLLPVLGTVGVIVLVGPLIALILYWNLLDRVRKHLKAITANGEPAVLPDMMG
jgi:hypothetical protein